jgi:hypothetical protein
MFACKKCHSWDVDLARFSLHLDLLSFSRIWFLLSDKQSSSNLLAKPIVELYCGLVQSSWWVQRTISTLHISSLSNNSPFLSTSSSSSYTRSFITIHYCNLRISFSDCKRELQSSEIDWLPLPLLHFEQSMCLRILNIWLSPCSWHIEQEKHIRFWRRWFLLNIMMPCHLLCHLLDHPIPYCPPILTSA